MLHICIFRDSCSSPRVCGLKNAKSHGVACGKEDATKARWIEPHASNRKPPLAQRKVCLAERPDRQAGLLGGIFRPVYSPTQNRGASEVVVWPVGLGEELCLWVTGCCLQSWARVLKASDWPGGKPQPHVWWSDSLWDHSLTPLSHCGLPSLCSHFHCSGRTSPTPSTAFSVSGVLEQAEAQIYFQPEVLTLAAPSSTRSLLNPLSGYTFSTDLEGGPSLCPEPKPQSCVQQGNKEELHLLYFIHDASFNAAKNDTCFSWNHNRYRMQ